MLINARDNKSGLMIQKKERRGEKSNCLLCMCMSAHAYKRSVPKSLF